MLLDLREEADLAEVDPEDRDVDLGHGTRGAQERAVAAEHDEQVRRRQLGQEPVVLGGGLVPHLELAEVAPGQGAVAQVHGGRVRRD